MYYLYHAKKDLGKERASDVPIPEVSLRDMLVYSHQYEIFHQVFRLAFYIHPFRWTNAMVPLVKRGSHLGNSWWYLCKTRVHSGNSIVIVRH